MAYMSCRRTWSGSPPRQRKLQELASTMKRRVEEVSASMRAIKMLGLPGACRMEEMVVRRTEGAGRMRPTAERRTGLAAATEPLMDELMDALMVRTMAAWVMHRERIWATGRPKQRPRRSPRTLQQAARPPHLVLRPPPLLLRRLRHLHVGAFFTLLSLRKPTPLHPSSRRPVLLVPRPVSLQPIASPWMRTHCSRFFCGSCVPRWT